MNKKAGIFILILVVAVGGIWFLGQKPKAPEQTAAPSSSGAMPPGHGQFMSTELPEVDEVTIDVQVAPELIVEGVTLTPGKTIRLQGSDLSLRATEFYTHWNWDQGAINLSKHENNPAVKVEVLKNGTVLYYGWAFKQMPFFRMSSHKGEDVGEQLAFTLMEYKGLTWPSGEEAK